MFNIFCQSSDTPSDVMTFRGDLYGRAEQNGQPVSYDNYYGLHELYNVQGKDVFVIPPHDLLSEQYLGQSGLLYDGAELALHPSDIYERIVEKHDFY